MDHLNNILEVETRQGLTVQNSALGIFPSGAYKELYCEDTMVTTLSAMAVPIDTYDYIERDFELDQLIENFDDFTAEQDHQPSKHELLKKYTGGGAGAHSKGGTADSCRP